MKSFVCAAAWKDTRETHAREKPQYGPRAGGGRRQPERAFDNATGQRACGRRQFQQSSCISSRATGDKRTETGASHSRYSSPASTQIATQHPLTAPQAKSLKWEPRGEMADCITSATCGTWVEARKVSERVTRLLDRRSRKSDALFPNFSGGYPVNIRQDIHSSSGSSHPAEPGAPWA